MSEPMAYCVVCKGMREMREVKQVERGGGPALEGKCAVCGSKVFALGAELQPRGNDAPPA